MPLITTVGTGEDQSDKVTEELDLKLTTLANLLLLPDGYL